ncbi:MAG: type IV toxin-antitoxin system AbiEi family antitoxin [Bacteroidia bacterium]
MLTNYLKPERFTLYTRQYQQDIMKKYKWVPDPDGEIYVYKPFWEMDSKKHVPDLLVYADLMETEDSRCIETAKMIYEQQLRIY